jgi:hypothetical protein
MMRAILLLATPVAGVPLAPAPAKNSSSPWCQNPDAPAQPAHRELPLALWLLPQRAHAHRGSAAKRGEQGGGRSCPGNPGEESHAARLDGGVSYHTLSAATDR